MVGIEKKSKMSLSDIAIYGSDGRRLKSVSRGQHNDQRQLMSEMDSRLP